MTTVAFNKQTGKLACTEEAHIMTDNRTLVEKKRDKTRLIIECLEAGIITRNEAMVASVHSAILANIATREHLDKLFAWQ
jgi:hypothetical protein